MNMKQKESRIIIIIIMSCKKHHINTRHPTTPFCAMHRWNTRENCAPADVSSTRYQVQGRSVLQISNSVFTYATMFFFFFLMAWRKSFRKDMRPNRKRISSICKTLNYIYLNIRQHVWCCTWNANGLTDPRDLLGSVSRPLSNS